MRGPILKVLDNDIYESVLNELISYYQDSEYVFVKIDPAFEESNELSVKPLSLGFKKCLNYVQPETPFFQDLVEGGEEELLAWCREYGMSKNYRTYIRKARKEGLTVRFSNEMEDWEAFTKYLSKSADSKEFVIHNPDYYIKQFEYMGEDDIVRLAIVELNGDPIAMLILSYFAGEVSCLYSAQTGLHTKMRGPLYMRWECMLDAQKRGFKRFNSWNVLDGEKYNPKSSQYGYSHFKRSFGGYVVKYQRTMDYPLNKGKYLLVKLLDLYRRLRFYSDR
jgi:lipid II:glycine glycyltransferase (peptidoglycan interpeptide bridge formation enzyme)